MAARRGSGRRLQAFNKRILLRDSVCTQPHCRRPSTQVHHDPPLMERNLHQSPYDPGLARGVCAACHLELTRELRRKHGLPYAPGQDGRAPQQPKLAAHPRANRVWLGGAFEGFEVRGPAMVTNHRGETWFAPLRSSSCV